VSRSSQPRSSFAQHGQPTACEPQAGQPDGFFVVTFPMSASTLFDWHTHEDHQLAWASAGVLTVRCEGATWVLPPTRALWIPAGLPHETGASSRATMRSVYVPPVLAPVDWAAPTVVVASPLLAELITYLGGELAATPRSHAEALLSDLLTPIPVAAFNVPFPDDQLAGPVARALRDNPADQRTLADWGRAVGASERTLARAFVAGAGVPFGHWRTLLRVQAALPLLAGGEPVSRVARRVGYETPSAFVAAFRRETGITPAAYFASA
jgi:AraC-like DNA-binding protein/quercetin dioxygenase-like cupin family protein